MVLLGLAPVLQSTTVYLNSAEAALEPYIMQQCFIAGILCLSLSLSLLSLVVVAVSTIDYALVISVANVVVFTPFWAFSASSIKINIYFEGQLGQELNWFA